jgi:hypothetical protein
LLAACADRNNGHTSKQNTAAAKNLNIIQKGLQANSCLIINEQESNIRKRRGYSKLMANERSLFCVNPRF